ncbi:asparagine synthase (glutamine-hydrolyzing) [Maribacter litoralis]|uniref:asparagine synthase (glutamine-hydrolyzing) n=1 Tax=Maribacter litoralis TaxID=2059726 RepID=A0A653VP29_9FLAO|nr:asparagine synthase (glutamine-hydrolyzing) [Maribacter litoralis]VXC03276.1 Asparagine synthase (Glutamine-hydrolysing) [Maribacter litoralis]
MCGIYGTTIKYSKEQFFKKLERTEFRGPDKMGLSTYKTNEGSITFGHNRLSIIDLDPRSNQPFTYASKIHLAFNGEIYNFKELKEILFKKGYSFNTTSDTEVICAAYLEYGMECVNYFNGMFAFVIYDEEKQILFGAKDRLGQKPLYYQLSKEGIEFASQISSIQLFNKQLTISQNSIENYLAWNNVPHPDSIFNEIKKIEDGNVFTFNLISKKFTTWPYWDISNNSSNGYKGNYDRAQNDLEGLLTNAVGIRMFADVPLGVFLSGGVDSSLIAALAKKNFNKVKTFSVKFDEKGFDESQYAKKVADHLETDHNIIECNYKEGIELIQNFSHYYDEPFADASAIPSMLLAKHTKKQVTVALSGDGADEAFLGYRRYQKLDKIQKTLNVPYFIRKLGGPILNVFQPNRYNGIKNILNAKSVEEAYLQMVVNTASPWLNIKTNVSQVNALKYLFNDNKNFYENASAFDLKTYLSWDINTKVDRATMAFSLEARSPFLDYRVVEMAQSLPTEFKYQLGNQKRILKDILYKHIPESYFNRPKSGFGMPLNLWFRNELKEMTLDELSLKNLKEIPGINPGITNKMIQQHMDGSWDHYSMIWKLLVLKQWISKNGAGNSIV